MTRLIHIIFLVVMFARCGDDPELHSSIFIRDIQNPDLPEYSEWGYNAFGAFYGTSVFISHTSPVSYITTTDSSMSFILSGIIINESNDTSAMSVTFVIPGYSPDTYPDLVELSGLVIDLKQPSCQVIISTNSDTFNAIIGSGELFFRHVRNVYIDQNPKEAILSGTFNFEALVNGQMVEVRLGRFDVGIDFV
jgi:hypothetical protein